ncbi:sulfoxide reductase heme-binding subunit YedZ [Kordiimonas sp. SCSIO 12603]|uniref:sulfite oxidase heme-binding subunit YedZ n=1 Tax=Kordiimonas sp. SCSIO 12603 TaxID=2829596 RepID=UPI002107CCD0|nr:protein-methionine-sulfoxide reductase heme-binding subunit MsrQ [Kordiimonas sp. SCSIO 12603]UTW60094.1 sulfoxide reductase heme-binding subunit YedZ [Kordiimonas sp. SCSIO 12603]
MKITNKQLRMVGKPIVFALMLIPAVWLSWNWYQAFQYLPNDLGFNPQETSNRFTGDWAMRILLISLALTPFSKLIKSPKPVLFRRMIGLFAFFYVCLHIISYVWLDMLFDWAELWQDVLKRLYITVGLGAFLLLIPLAVTSTQGWVKRMGAKSWQRLHKVVYAVGVLVIIHFAMMRKGFQIEPLIYGGILGLLFVLRIKAVQQVFRRRKAI